MGGADVLAVCQRRQTLHVHTEQTRERVRLCLAELGEFARHVLDGAVPLAELGAQGRDAGGGGADGRRVAVVRQRRGERLRAAAGVRTDGVDPGR